MSADAVTVLYDGLDDFRIELENGPLATIPTADVIAAIRSLLRASEQAEKHAHQLPFTIRLRADDEYALALSRATSLIPHLADSEGGVLIIPVPPSTETDR